MATRAPRDNWFRRQLAAAACCGARSQCPCGPQRVPPDPVGLCPSVVDFTPDYDGGISFGFIAGTNNGLIGLSDEFGTLTTPVPNGFSDLKVYTDDAADRLFVSLVTDVDIPVLCDTGQLNYSITKAVNPQGWDTGALNNYSEDPELFENGGDWMIELVAGHEYCVTITCRQAA